MREVPQSSKERRKDCQEKICGTRLEGSILNIQALNFTFFFTGGFPADDCELALVLGNIIMVI